VIGVLESGAWRGTASRPTAWPPTWPGAWKASRGSLHVPAAGQHRVLQMPPATIDRLRERGWHFYTFIGCGGAPA